MSIDLDWSSLTTGPEGVELAASIRDFIDDKFQQVHLPRFIRSVHVHTFDFGHKPPVIEVKDICDPWDEFYEDEEAEDSSDDEDQGAADDGGIETSRNSGHAGTTEKSTHESSQSKTNSSDASVLPKAGRPNYIDTHIPNLRAGFPHQQHESISTPFLSRASTPVTGGIPGGTSNFSYFHHLPLGGLSGTTTPLAGITGFNSQPIRQDTTAQYPTRSQHNDNYQPEHTAMGPPPLPGIHTSDHQRLNSDPQHAEDDRSSDLQTMLHISYDGDLSLSLTAEILLDYPMPSFVSIPLKLQITGMSFDGVGVVAYIHRQGKDKGGEEDGSKRKVHFCFLGGEDAEVMLAPGDSAEVNQETGFDAWSGDHKATTDSDTDPISKRAKHNEDSSSRQQNIRNAQKRSGGGPLHEIRVESEIGRKEPGKQSLKNVGKVERFVLEQVRRIFEEEFVWPSFWTVLV